ncbi:MAG TPA: hypothetical protein VNL18_12000 [Gemmatimonadales bacterium]|nr:hypothetical protein [Gemmatimonadales bacterium]
MNHHAAEAAMFWVGALFVLAPILFAGVVLGVWWYGRRRERRAGRQHEPATQRP